MIPAPRLEKEEQRLAAVKKLGLLDSPIEERFERITRMVQRIFGVSVATFTVVDSERQWFKSIQGLGATETPRDVSFCGHAIARKDEVLLVPDAREDARFSDNPLVTGAPNIQFYAGCPIRSPEGEAVGTLCAIDTRPRAFSPDEVQTLRDLAAMIETELRASMLSDAQVELIAELSAAEQMSLVDPMTRLWNRNGILTLLGREWSKSLRNHSSLSVVIADIDHFKRINDTHGHPVGDAVIQQVGRRLLGALRTEDAVGRIGGEEFLIVLTGCLPEKLADTVERIRRHIGQTPIATEAGPLEVKLSFGAASCLPGGEQTGEALIKRADDALYVAKRNGRDQAHIAA